MLQRMEAEILFLDPNDLGPSVVTLTELDFEVEVLDWIDDFGPTVWLKARIASELDQNAFFHWVHAIVDRLQGADLVVAGLADSPPPRFA